MSAYPQRAHREWARRSPAPVGKARPTVTFSVSQTDADDWHLIARDGSTLAVRVASSAATSAETSAPQAMPSARAPRPGRLGLLELAGASTRPCCARAIHLAHLGIDGEQAAPLVAAMKLLAGESPALSSSKKNIAMPQAAPDLFKDLDACPCEALLLPVDNAATPAGVAMIGLLCSACPSAQPAPKPRRCASRSALSGVPPNPRPHGPGSPIVV